MIPMDKICKAYVSQVKAILPVWGKKEKAFVKKLHNDLYDYCEDKKIKDTLQLELIMNLIKAWINFKEEIKGLYWIFDCEKKVIYIGSEMNWGE